MSIKDIQWRQPKYMLPAILYFPLLLAGYLIINLFSFKKAEHVDESLQTTEYLNANLPEANVKEGLGSKRDNVREIFGDIHDRTAVMDTEASVDSTTHREGYDSKYSKEEEAHIDAQEAEQERKKREEEARKAAAVRDGSSQRGGGTTYVPGSIPPYRPKTDAQRDSALRVRRGEMYDELNAQLGGVLDSGRRRSDDLIRRYQEAYADSVADADGEDDSRGGGGGRGAKDKKKGGKVEGSMSLSVKSGSSGDNSPSAVKALDSDNHLYSVAKVVSRESDHFNTVSSNEEKNRLIKAIVDEELKAVDGSRVRLRLLDDITLEGTLLPKGTYLYATLSDFSSQRVKGKIESVLVHDRLFKINLSMYDMDGLEGLYVPESAFRETAKEVGSGALGTNMNMNEMTGSNGTSVTQWASQAVQQAYQRTSQAISKAIKKKKVRIKYGTHVYLINNDDKNGRR